MSIDKAFKIIDDNIDQADFVGKINNSTIVKLENQLEINLPLSFKQFLEKYGCGDIFGIEIFGIISDETIEAVGIPSIYWLTNELRNEGLGKNYIPISEDGMGNYYVLITSKDNNGECQVGIYENGNLEVQIIYESFGKFLLNQLEENI